MKAHLDGRVFESAERLTILEAARRLGRRVPPLCDPPRLEPAAACRICLVEVEGRRDPVPACATPLEDGMRVGTDTPRLQRLRREVLALILSDHPSACLVCAERAACREPKEGIRKTAEPTGCVLCPADGRCRLQRVAEEVGLERTAFPESPRSAEPRRDDPLIDRDAGLCILCGLCVRACRDGRGASVLTFAGRGGRTVIAAALDGTLLESGCRFCGACLDVCPTGALFERALRYSRPDETKPALCGWCGEGCLLQASLEKGRLAGMRPDEGGRNRGQACLKGRFLLPDLLGHPERLTAPLVRRGGAMVQASWQEALAAAAEGLQRAEGPLEVVATAQDSCEDLLAMAGFGGRAFDSGRFSLAGPRSPLEILRLTAGLRAEDGWPDLSPPGLSAMKAVLVLDEDLAVAAPILEMEVFQAARAGARLAVFGARETCLDRCARIHVRMGGAAAAEVILEAAALLVRTSSDREAESLAGILRAAREGSPALSRTERAAVEEKAGRIAALLGKRRPAAFLVGPGYLEGPSGPRLSAGLWNLALLVGARLVPVLREANARGAAELVWRGAAGGSAIPAAGRVFTSAPGPLPPRRDGAFVVAAAAFRGAIPEGADVVLPRTLFAEQEGTWVNGEGRVQRSRPAAPAPGAARPLWRMAAELAEALGRPLAWAASAQDVLARLEAEQPRFSGARAARPASAACVPVPGPDPETGGETRRPDPDDIHGFAAASALKALKAVRRR